MKRIKSVLKRFLLWIGAAALLWLMAGCRTSDENTTHPVWKGTEYWIDAAKAEGEAELPKVSARVNAPPRVEKVLTDESGRLTVTINADVEISDAAAAGIYKLEAADFSQETVTLLFQRLCEGRNMLEPPSGMTKRQVEAEIAAWEEAARHSSGENLENAEARKDYDGRQRRFLLLVGITLLCASVHCGGYAVTPL